MSIRNTRPSGDDNPKSVAGGESSEKAYRAKTINLSLGGLNAVIDSYIGVDIVPMRIIPIVSVIHGMTKYGFMFEGFDPDTGQHIMFFFDPRLRNDKSGYVKNFDGSIAIEFGRQATEDEFYAIMEDINAENGTNYDYNYEDWNDVGGVLKLAPRLKGKPVVIGKKFVKIKSGNNMNILQLDFLDVNDYPHLQEDIARYESLEGVPYNPDEEEAEASSEYDEVSDTEESQNASRSFDEEEPVEEPEPQPVKKAPRVQTRSGSRDAPVKKPVTRNRFASDAEDVSKEFDKPQAGDSGIVREVSIPEQVSEFIKTGYEKHMSTDQIVLGLIETGHKESDSINYVNAWLNRREGRTLKKATEVKKQESKPAKPAESDVVRVARECKEKGMDSPETFDVLNKRFPKASREDKRAALKTAGLVKF